MHRIITKPITFFFTFRLNFSSKKNEYTKFHNFLFSFHRAPYCYTKNEKKNFQKKPTSFCYIFQFLKLIFDRKKKLNTSKFTIFVIFPMTSKSKKKFPKFYIQIHNVNLFSGSQYESVIRFTV